MSCENRRRRVMTSARSAWTQICSLLMALLLVGCVSESLAFQGEQATNPAWPSDLVELRKLSLEGERDYLALLPKELPPHLSSVEHSGGVGERGTQITYYHEGMAVEFVSAPVGDWIPTCEMLQPPQSSYPVDCLREIENLNGLRVLIYTYSLQGGPPGPPPQPPPSVYDEELRTFWRTVELVTGAPAWVRDVL